MTADGWRAALAGFERFVLGYFAVLNTVNLILLVCAIVELRRHLVRIRLEQRLRLLGSQVAPSLSVLAPAYNEGVTVGESVRALLTLRYPNLEVVLVNDGSSDETLEVLHREFGLIPVHPVFRRRLDTQPVQSVYRSSSHPELVVVDKKNGGKADALNAGLNVASGELVCAIDADTIIEPDALLRMVRPFLTRNDVVAAGGTIRVVNGSLIRSGRVLEVRAPTRLLPGVQTVEYLRAFLFGRLGWNLLGGNLIISGAFGLFRRGALVQTGGYLHDTVGEDMELVARLRRNGVETKTPQRISFVPDPVAWTEVPSSLQVLGRQRDRWHRGLADVLWRHRKVMGNPRYGVLGLVTFPYFFIELIGPVLELLGLVGLVLALLTDSVSVEFGGLFVAVSYGYGLLLTGLALMMEEFSDRRYRRVRDQLLLFWWAALEQFGYRQLTILWRLRGIWKFLRGNHEWGTMVRSGFTTVPIEPVDRSPPT